MSQLQFKKSTNLKLLNENGLIVVESSIDTQLNDKEWSHLIVKREKAYRTNKFTFIEYKKGEIE